MTDLLHQVHKFVRDHVCKWVMHMGGQDEIDHRYQSLQHHVGMQTFPEELSGVKQWNSHKDHEMMQYLVAITAGARHMTNTAVTNLRAIMEFVYLAQLDSHNNETLESMETQLQIIHRTKNVWVTLGSRQGKSAIP